jgi:hypothetical protein
MKKFLTINFLIISCPVYPGSDPLPGNKSTQSQDSNSSISKKGFSKLSHNIFSLIIPFLQSKDLYNFSKTSWSSFKTISEIQASRDPIDFFKTSFHQENLTLLFKEMHSESFYYLSQKQEKKFIASILQPNQSHLQLGSKLAQISPIIIRMNHTPKELESCPKTWVTALAKSKVPLMISHPCLLKEEQLLPQIFRYKITLDKVKEGELSWVIPLIQKHDIQISLVCSKDILNIEDWEENPENKTPEEIALFKKLIQIIETQKVSELILNAKGTWGIEVKISNAIWKAMNQSLRGFSYADSSTKNAEDVILECKEFCNLINSFGKNAPHLRKITLPSVDCLYSWTSEKLSQIDCELKKLDEFCILNSFLFSQETISALTKFLPPSLQSFSSQTTFDEQREEPDFSGASFLLNRFHNLTHFDFEPLHLDYFTQDNPKINSEAIKKSLLKHNHLQAFSCQISNKKKEIQEAYAFIRQFSEITNLFLSLSAENSDIPEKELFNLCTDLKKMKALKKITLYCLDLNEWEICDDFYIFFALQLHEVLDDSITIDLWGNQSSQISDDSLWEKLREKTKKTGKKFEKFTFYGKNSYFID